MNQKPDASLLPFSRGSRAPVPALASGSSYADGTVISLSTFMADEHTRVADYNGRRLVSNLGRETFSGVRVSRLPSDVIEHASSQPVTSALLPCRVGYFPNARGHKVSRPNGDWSYTLLLCLEGEGRLDLAESRSQMSRGSMAILKPFEFHAYEADVRNPWSLYWIHFNGRMAGEYHDLLTGGGRRPCSDIGVDLRLVQSFERIRSLYQQGFSFPVLVQASAVMHQLLGDMHEMLHNRQQSPEDARTKIQRAIDIMRENPGSNLTIYEFAAATHMSQMYFSAKFREYTGESPRSFFTRVKMEKACQLLVQTRLKVEIIAQMVGYDDAFYFSRAFKRVIGDTPSRYRICRVGASDVPLMQIAR